MTTTAPATQTPRPAGAKDCLECDGTAQETLAEEILDAAGELVVGERVTVTGTCQCCDGRGWFPRETAWERQDRLDREAAEAYARHVRQVREHRASGTCTAKDATGRGCWATRKSHRMP